MSGFRFRVHALFFITLIVALALATIPDNPAAAPLVVFDVFAFPAILLIVAIFGTGRARAFCIGALVPTVALLLIFTIVVSTVVISGPLQDLARVTDSLVGWFRLWCWVAWSQAVLVGLCAVVTFGLLKRPE